MTTNRAARRASRGAGALAATTAIAVLTGLAPTPAHAAPTYPSDEAKPDLVAADAGFSDLWQPSGLNDLHGTVKDARTLAWNDRLTSWINQHATKQQRFRALQNAAYLNADGSGYDQSITIADGLGERMGRYYAQGRIDGSLPLTTAMINSSKGSTGAYVSTGTAKAAFSYPRPFVPADPGATAPKGDEADCAPSKINSSSVAPIRRGKAWADAHGNLKITRVAAVTDTTHRYAKTDVKLDPAYGEKGICTGGAFPSGHTTTAYQAGITLATLLPELAPQILARTSEAGNNRIVLGVHYPLDIVGGRINGETALASRWADADFRAHVLEPARAELVAYLEKRCGARLTVCIARDTSYYDNPYNGAKIPGGTAQIVRDRRSAVKVYTERLGYGFTPTRSTHQAASVPAKAESLLRTTFPTLTAKQRRAVLAQTEIASGHPLDTSRSSRHGTTPGSWQRLNLAAAMSATVRVFGNGRVEVIATGGQAKVIKSGR